GKYCGHKTDRKWPSSHRQGNLQMPFTMNLQANSRSSATCRRRIRTTTSPSSSCPTICPKDLSTTQSSLPMTLNMTMRITSCMLSPHGQPDIYTSSNRYVNIEIFNTDFTSRNKSYIITLL